MTFPNRAGYTPGQQRRDPKCLAVSSEESSLVTVKATAVVHKGPPLRRSLREKTTAVKTEGMQQELQIMLASLAPAQGGPTLPMLTKEENKAFVEHSRKRLLEDQAFQGNESFQRMLMFANNPAVKAESEAVNPFAAVIEKMPINSQSYNGFGASSDGFSSSAMSRSQYMNAVAMHKMADAVEQVEDPTIKAQYEQTAQRLHEWGERRMQQKQQPQPTNTGGGANLLPSFSVSLSQVSPYAMDLAARNSMPRKRSSLSKKSKKLMQDWFEHNLHHPYPTEEEKEWLAREGGIALEQVNNWFINTRGRKWKPMLNRLMAEKRAGDCSLYDKMVKKIEEPYHKL